MVPTHRHHTNQNCVMFYKSNDLSSTFFFEGDKPTMKQLMQDLHNTVADKWFLIGIYLEISAAQLKTMEEKNRGDPQKCLMVMLSEWLTRVCPPPTWQDLAEAVEFFGYSDVAQKLRQKYC